MSRILTVDYTFNPQTAKRDTSRLWFVLLVAYIEVIWEQNVCLQIKICKCFWRDLNLNKPTTSNELKFTL